ncbi:hypothetical protein LPJ53_004059 [Coemansia erecta]|uniref:Nudix hydrolase domain-containing protein n=1 Tax=Coemansia erecta TaxID=147472 RepID=A0A9W7XZU9_9FUNG|nr:hypothetical protein LPJ53_004059 [Coemansia erecta]
MHRPRLSASLVITAPLAQKAATAGAQTAANYRVLMVRRVNRGAFAGALVFPGGVQEPSDSGPLACALRETSEETGIRLPAPLAHPIGRWLTPRAKQQPKRFDTRFFMVNLCDSDAALEQLGRARPQAGELEHLCWVAPADVLEMNRRGELPLFPPQFCIVREMSQVKRWQELAAGLRHLAAAAPVEPVLCRRSDGRVVAVLPGDWAYPADAAAAAADGDMRVADGHLFEPAGALGREMNRLVMERAAEGGFGNIRLIRTADADAAGAAAGSRL